MLDAYGGSLYLYRLDSHGECVIELDSCCTFHDAESLCDLLTWGGVPVDDALLYVERFVDWWNASDVCSMIEAGSDGELRDALEPFRHAGVCADIVGLRWMLG